MLRDLPKRKADYAKQVLSEKWDVTDWGSSITLLEKLSKSENDNPLVSEIFGNIIEASQYEIIRGIFTPLKQDSLLGLDIPNYFGHLWKVSTNKANSDIAAFMDFLHGAEDANKTFHGITASMLLNRINSCISGYEQAMRSLTVSGYTREELTSISNFSAWDLGRCGYIAKLAATAGFIDNATAYQYMMTVGSSAYKTYRSWRQFLAAYFIGHSIIDGNAKGIEAFGETISYLLKDKKSPYQKFPLKFA
ncbi:MAG: DUF1266 domain-containing protein [Defluviitaleaceae bacterium]|nr:DUF1266 domain-containing protein [Defluviitaleaceae bacterium]